MKHILSFLVALAITLGLMGTASGGRTTVELRSQDVSVREAQEEEHGPHFVMEVDVPEGLTSEALLGAILEFAVDADTRVDTVWVQDADSLKAIVQITPAPMVEVFALTSSAGFAADRENWNEEMSFLVPVGVGSDKIIRINITRAVKFFIENPEANHGLVVGSLTGEKLGVFSLREHYGSGVKARIRYVY